MTLTHLEKLMQQQPAIIKPLPVWTYVLGLALWLSLCAVAATIVIERNIREVEKDLAHYGDAYSDQLNRKLVSSETILKGFSALFGAVGNTDPDRVSLYVRQVIEANSQIFALEIVQAVAHSHLEEMVARKRREGMPDFTVKSFSYDSDRKWHPLKEKPVYYPIVYMEPMRPGSEDIIGLDVDSVPFLRQAMIESLQQHTSISSHPFRLVEGNLAYVVFRPIPLAFERNSPPPTRIVQEELLVNMVIDVANLVEPVRFPILGGETVLVYHTDFRPDDPKGQLLALSGQVRSTIETALFPAFVYRKSLATMGEPFSLTVKRQVGWSDLSLGLLALMLVLTLLSSLMLVAYLRARQQSRFLLIENQQRLWQLANHDALTGLPNRLLLMDRMEQLLARMQRQGKRLAVMFMDLDDFKQINDTYGHAVGDQLLKFVAECLRTAVRANDTVARMSGDEFIILIDTVVSTEALDAVKQKIQAKLSEGFQIDGQHIFVRTSMGIAIFPEDGDSPDALIRQADIRMYADKQDRSAKLYLA